jgi:peptidoglycan hydrolase-like protein with peptidoglycan-binding domain
MVPGYGPMMVQSPYAPSSSPNVARSVQMELNRLGYLRAPADGTVGPQTSTAISQYQRATGLPVDGMPSSALLTRLQATP